MNKYELSFEVISQIFQSFFRIDTVSHCDIMRIELDEGRIKRVTLIEDTVYVDKNLLDKNIYKNEVSEIVKKMWGTYSILIWYLTPESLRKNKIFILRAKINPRFSRILGKLIREVRGFKDGAYSDVKFEEV
jgi:hypothetical protein